MQLEKELAMVTKSEEWDIKVAEENWQDLSAKIGIFAELESQTNRILRDALSKQQEEVNSFPPDADGEHTLYYIYCTLPSHISSWSSECEKIIYIMPVCIVALEVTSACIYTSFFPLPRITAAANDPFFGAY